MNYKTLKTTKGFSLLELVLAIAIFGMGSIAAGYMLIDAGITSRMALEKAEATLIAREGIEAVTSMRDLHYSNLTAGAHGLTSNTFAWSFSGTKDTSSNKYVRVVNVALTSGASITQNFATVDVTVSWWGARNATTSVILSTILTNWRNN